jgi:hypothetical protein
VIDNPSDPEPYYEWNQSQCALNDSIPRYANRFAEQAAVCFEKALFCIGIGQLDCLGKQLSERRELGLWPYAVKPDKAEPPRDRASSHP